MAVRRYKKKYKVGILRPAISLVALKRDLFRGAIAFGLGAKFVKEREHAQLAFGHAEGGASRVRRLDAMVQVKAFQQLAEGARFTTVYHGAYRWQGQRWHTEAARGVCAPELLPVPAGFTVAGNAAAAYGERLAPQAAHVPARPSAAALLRLAPALLAQGGALPAAQALPLYVRDKVAQTTAERAAAQAARSTV